MQETRDTIIHSRERPHVTTMRVKVNALSGAVAFMSPHSTRAGLTGHKREARTRHITQMVCVGLLKHAHANMTKKSSYYKRIDIICTVTIMKPNKTLPLE